jgi:autoinducer 2-degrading protein
LTRIVSRLGVLVSLQVKTGERARFLSAIARNAETSVKSEVGCLAFDVIADTDHEDQFHLYEVYLSEEAYREHQVTLHYADWRREAEFVLVRGSQIVRKGILISANE